MWEQRGAKDSMPSADGRISTTAIVALRVDLLAATTGKVQAPIVESDFDLEYETQRGYRGHADATSRTAIPTRPLTKTETQ